MSKPKLHYLVGLPGSGKSTYAQKLSIRNDTIVLSSDEIRKSKLEDINDQTKNNDVFKYMRKKTIDYLKAGLNVVYDATNIVSKRRKGFLDSIKHVECEKTCYIIAAPIELCLERNKNRDRIVPEEVIWKMYKQWQTPYFFEGWNDIIIVAESNHSLTFRSITDSMYGFNQDNPNHKLDLYNHCFDARHYIIDKYPHISYEVELATSYHDMGKLKTKQFMNAKGEPTKEAHYYNHENVGAYDAMLLFYEFGNYFSLDVSTLINYHMLPYSWNEDKARKRFGDKLVEDLLLLHEADLNAH